MGDCHDLPEIADPRSVEVLALSGRVLSASDLGLAQVAATGDLNDLTLELGRDFLGTLTSFLQDLVP